jgi:RecA-family ATPase
MTTISGTPGSARTGDYCPQHEKAPGDESGAGVNQSWQGDDTETLRTEPPARMRNAKRWLLWKLIQAPGAKKPRKVPFYCDGSPRRGALDTPEDTARLATFEDALEALGRGGYTGLGFALGPDGSGFWQGIDLDHTDTRPELAALVDLLPGYVERSPSGTGVHALGYGPRFVSLGANSTGIEAYSQGRYFTVTGDAIGGGIADLSQFVDGTLAALHEIHPQAQGNADGLAETADDATIRDLRSALASIRSDDRETWIRMGHALHGLGDVGRGLWLEWSQTSEKWQPADAKKWDEFEHTHIGYAAVFAEAKRHGWINPASRPGPHERPGNGPDSQDPGPWAEQCDETGEPPDHGTAQLRRSRGAVRATVPAPATLVATEAELEVAHLHPRCIVDRHTYADLAQVIAPGGTGKTTLLIYESVHIAIGRPLYGLEVLSPGWTLFVTAEDQRPHLLARMREILQAMDLTEEERAAAIAGFRVWDVTGEQVKLIHTTDGNIVLTDLAADIVAACQADPPAVVVFDPTVSFGASEQAVNDNEQGLVTAARRIVKGIDCCVRLVHHTGKGNAREKTLDQYSGRGGSAMPDGSRMTTVLQSWTPAGAGTLRPPAGCTPDQKASITILARAKLSYAPPNLPLIWIKRTGFFFEHFTELPVSREEARAAKETQLLRFLASEVSAGKYHSQKTLEDVAEDIGMSRTALRRALSGLRARMEVYDADLPEDLRKGGRKTYLSPSNLATHPREVPTPEGPFGHPPAEPDSTSRPIRVPRGGEVAAPSLTPLPGNLAEETREVPARWRGSDPEAQKKPEPEQGSVPEDDIGEDRV